MRTSYPNVLPVQITERIKNISDIYKIANIKLTPINKSYPLISTESPRVEIYFPSDSVLNLDNAILEAELTFNHLGAVNNAPQYYVQSRYPPRYGLASLIQEINVYINGIQVSPTKQYNFIHNWIKDWVQSFDVNMNDGINTCDDPSVIYTYQTGRIVPRRGYPVSIFDATNDVYIIPAKNARHQNLYHMNLGESLGFFGEGSSKILNTAILGEIKLEIIFTSQIACCSAGSLPAAAIADNGVGVIPAQLATSIYSTIKSFGAAPSTFGTDTQMTGAAAAAADQAAARNQLVSVCNYIRRRARLTNVNSFFTIGDTLVPETGSFDNEYTTVTANGAAVAAGDSSYTISNVILHIEALQFKNSDYYDIMNQLVDSGKWKYHFKRYVLQNDAATAGTARTIDYRMVVNSECLNYILATFRPAAYLTPANPMNTLISPQGTGNTGAFQATFQSQVNSGLPFTFNNSRFFCRNGLNVGRMGWKVDETYFEPRTKQEMYFDNLRHWRNYKAGELTIPHKGLKNVHDFTTCYFTGLLSFETKSDDDVKSVYNLRGLNTNGKAISISCQTENTNDGFVDMVGGNLNGASTIAIAPAAGDIPTFLICTTVTLELNGRRNVDIKY